MIFKKKMVIVLKIHLKNNTKHVRSKVTNEDLYKLLNLTQFRCYFIVLELQIH